MYYMLFTPLVNRLVLAASVFLLIYSFVDRAVLAAPWYHCIEGIVTLLFVSEIALRLSVMKSSFWESKTNIVEAAMCVVCVLIFFILHFAAYTTRLEHNALIVLRYSAQILRTVGLMKGGSSADVAQQSTFDVYGPGGAYKDRHAHDVL